jgi:DNA invertase Pin-like site-specific DNA recombinase
MRRAVGYVRISKDRPDETSTTTQEASIRAWCAAQRVELVDVIVEPGRSAFKASRTSRPGIRKAMALIEAGAADAFVCWKLDRAARNTRDLLEFVEDDLGAHGATFVSVTEQFDTFTPMGMVMMTIIAALAQMESATKSQRTTEWQTHRRATGATPTGPRPYGYRRQRNALVIDEAEATVVKGIAAAVVAGQSLRSIVRGLNDRGLVTRNGTPFNTRGVRATMLGTTVAGLRQLDGRYVPGTWPAILDRHTWDDVRAVLRDPKRNSGGSGLPRRWLLSGLASCGREGCGGPMGMRPHRAGPRYTCDTCFLSIDAHQADDVVQGDVLDLLDRRTWKRLQRRGRHVDTADLEQRLVDLAQQRADHEITEPVWQVLNAGLMADLDEATAEPVALPDVDDIRAAWADLSIDARRLVVNAAVRITVTPVVRLGANRFDPDRVQYDWLV